MHPSNGREDRAGAIRLRPTGPGDLFALFEIQTDAERAAKIAALCKQLSEQPALDTGQT